MAVRIISSIIGLPLLIGIVALGGIYLKIGIAVVSLIGMYEFFKAVSKKITAVHIISFIVAFLYLLFLGTDIIDVSKQLFVCFIVALMVTIVFFHKKININDASTALFGFFYIAYMFSNIYLVRLSALGKYMVWTVFICAFCCDTGAYFVGITLGKHKLCPELSPKKTIEGAIGGVVFSAIGTTIFGYIVSKILTSTGGLAMGIFMLFMLAIGIIGAVFAQLGDLCASAIKRYTGIKDFGNIIPGHGGILDRFDSVLFTSAVVWFMLQIMTGISHINGM